MEYLSTWQHAADASSLVIDHSTRGRCFLPLAAFSSGLAPLRLGECVVCNVGTHANGVANSFLCAAYPMSASSSTSYVDRSVQLPVPSDSSPSTRDAAFETAMVTRCGRYQRSAVSAPVCTRLTVARPIGLPNIDIEQVKNNMLYLHVCSGALVRIREHDLRVVDARPDAACVRVQGSTLISWAAVDEPDSAIASEPLMEDTVADQPHIERVSFELRVSEACASETVRALREICEFPAKYKSAFDHMGIECPRGLLLHGPSSSGKTSAVRAMAASLSARLFSFDGSECTDSSDSSKGKTQVDEEEPFVGQTEELLRRVFERARLAAAAGSTVMLLLDDLDMWCPARGDASTAVSARTVAQLLALMDGQHSNNGLIVVGVTSKPQNIDAALRRAGRFDREVEIRPPTVAQRAAALALLLSGPTCTRGDWIDISNTDIQCIAEQTVGFVIADLVALQREATLRAVRLALDAQQVLQSVRLQLSHFQRVIASGIIVASSIRGHTEPVELPSSTDATPQPASTAGASPAWGDIGGLAAVKQRLQQAVEWPLRFAAQFERLALKPPRGVLMYGPPGCAKTTLVRAIAKSASLAFLSLDAASVFASHLGESERVLRDAFQRARANRPCVLFLDELDAMTGQRGGSSTSLENRIVATLLTEMDGVEAASGVLVVGATNRPALIDVALMRPGRFDVLLHVPPPDAVERAEIVRVLLRRQEFEPEVALRIDEIAERTQGCSGADLTSLAREAALIALRRDPLAARVLWQDWDHALSELQPSLTVEIVQEHFDFERRVSQQKSLTHHHLTMSLSTGGTIALSLSAAYVIASAILFAFPKLLHKMRRPAPCPIKTGAHRGGAAERPENTIMAFENARRLGMDLLELDCYLTKDKQVVVVHDSDLSRLCVDCNAKVGSFDFADLPRVQVQPLLPPEFHLHGLRLEPYWAETADGKVPAEVSQGQPIPLLEEVFRTFPDATINIDCKIPDIELVDKVIALVRQYKRQDRTIIGAFADWTGQQIRERAPDIPRIFSAKETLLIYLQYFLGLLPFVALHADYFEVPLFSSIANDRLMENITHKSESPSSCGQKCKNFFTRILLSILGYVTSRRWLYWHLQQRGVRVIFWVLNDDADFAQALDECGADGVMTDKPSVLAKYMQAKQSSAGGPSGSSM